MSQRYPKIFLKPGREMSVIKGHPWIFSGAIAFVEGKPEPGDIIDVLSHNGEPLAAGFFNPLTSIAIRILTMQASSSVDYDFWRNRVRSALALRQKIIPPQTNAYRLVNAEGDRIPGLIVDRYAEYLVFSIATAGAEKWRKVLLDVLLDEIKPYGIYERSEGQARQFEGLDERVGLHYGEIPSSKIKIMENRLSFEVDISSGQKTGFFFDQRPNRERVEKLSNGANVLNCFSYTGAFSVYSGRGGAKRVVSIETSESANELAKHHFEINGLSRELHTVISADVFSYLREGKERFDLIILDPPAFAKTKKDIPRAARGYKDINLQAIRRLQKGGFLVTFSCSNHIDGGLFKKIVLGAVQDAGRTAQMLEVLGAGPDHPVQMAHSEGAYLKGFILRITN
jgi:23S rRNA (cytosine1962-C5)-methyltransferase